MSKKEYFPPEAEVLYVRLEAGVLSVGTNPFDEEDDDIFGGD